jgi:hypothetical protein
MVIYVCIGKEVAAAQGCRMTMGANVISGNLAEFGVYPVLKGFGKD